jgi:hypothetical protein
MREFQSNGEIIGASEYQDTVCLLEFLIKDGCLGHLKKGFGPWICWIGDGATQAARIVNVGCLGQRHGRLTLLKSLERSRLSIRRQHCDSIGISPQDEQEN